VGRSVQVYVQLVVHEKVQNYAGRKAAKFKSTFERGKVAEISVCRTKKEQTGRDLDERCNLKQEGRENITFRHDARSFGGNCSRERERPQHYSNLKKHCSDLNDYVGSRQVQVRAFRMIMQQRPKAAA
jgi:hypothetical protein